MHSRALQKAETGTSRSHCTGPLAAVKHSVIVGVGVGVQFPLRVCVPARLVILRPENRNSPSCKTVSP